MNKSRFALIFSIATSPLLFINVVSAKPLNDSLLDLQQINNEQVSNLTKFKACSALNSELLPYRNCDFSNRSNIKLNSFEKALQFGAMYSSKYWSRLNSQGSSKSIGQDILNDSKSLLIALGNDYVNKSIKGIPFLSQTQIGIDFTSNADTKYFLNGVFKIADLGNDPEGKPQGILFAQGNVIGTSSSSVTTNLGLGARKRINDNAMLGINAFWDYRMTSYSSAYSRWGAGGEVWWNDFKLTNNWYIAGTGIKRITTSGSSYVNEDNLDPGTYSFSEWAGANTYDERVVPGWDLGLNYRLPGYPQLSLGVRGFRWDYMRHSDNTGVEGTVNWQATPRTNLTAWVSNENPAYQTLSNTQLDQRGSDTYYGLRFTVQLQPVKYKKGSDHLSERLLTDMAQPVARKNDILLERWKPDLDKTIDGEPSVFQNRASGI